MPAFPHQIPGASEKQVLTALTGWLCPSSHFHEDVEPTLYPILPQSVRKLGETLLPLHHQSTSCLPPAFPLLLKRNVLKLKESVMTS